MASVRWLKGELTMKTDNAYGRDYMPWITEKAVFPHGTEFRGKFKGKFYPAIVDNGALVLTGRRFLSPSAAAASITQKIKIDEWVFWEYKQSETGSWVNLNGS
jgi:hypothetical protein